VSIDPAVIRVTDSNAQLDDGSRSCFYASDFDRPMAPAPEATPNLLKSSACETRRLRTDRNRLLPSA